jgi:hypothetical protein
LKNLEKSAKIGQWSESVEVCHENLCEFACETSAACGKLEKFSDWLLPWLCAGSESGQTGGWKLRRGQQIFD